MTTWVFALFDSLDAAGVDVADMPVHRFLVLTTIGSGIWNGVLIGLGWCLGENWTVLEDGAGVASTVVLGLVVAALVALAVRRVRAPAR